LLFKVPIKISVKIGVKTSTNIGSQVKYDNW
jgi:hypothetical protein